MVLIQVTIRCQLFVLTCLQARNSRAHSPIIKGFKESCVSFRINIKGNAGLVNSFTLNSSVLCGAVKEVQSSDN